MRIVTHVSKSYDWEPVPSDVQVTPADVAAGKAKPTRAGGYSMRVTKPGPTWQLCALIETDIVAKILHERFRDGPKRRLSRADAVGYMLAEHFYPQSHESKWITKIELSDDGPVEQVAQTAFEPHSERHLRSLAKDHLTARGFPGGEYQAGQYLTDADVAEHLRLYLEPVDPVAMVTHLHAFFGVKVAS